MTLHRKLLGVGSLLALAGCFAPLKDFDPEADEPERGGAVDSDSDQASTGNAGPGPSEIGRVDAGVPRPAYDAGVGAPLPPTPPPGLVQPPPPVPTRPPFTPPTMPPTIPPTVPPTMPPVIVPPDPGEPEPPSPSLDLEPIDAYVLARSIDQLASLELRRGGQPVWTRTREQIQQFVPQPSFHLTELAFKKRWLDTFWAWTYQQSMSANADALRIADALSRYHVGVQSVTIGPECQPSDGSYQRGIISAGSPGDETFERFEAELLRSEDQVLHHFDHHPEMRCLTGLQAAAPAQQVAVVIDLPLDPGEFVSDEQIWTGDAQHKQRAGIPFPRGLYPNVRDDSLGFLEPADSLATLVRIDGYVLRDSLAQTDQLEVRRNGTTLFTRSQAEIAALQTSAGAALTSLQRTGAWVDAFRTWLSASASAGSDAVQIARALSSYWIGVNTVSIGPRCGPISSAYQYGFVSPGVPGDDTLSTLADEVQRSEAESQHQVSRYPTTSCITSLHPNPTGNVAPVRVIIELPSEQGWLSDTQIWSQSSDGSRVRVGVPVPSATQLWRGAQAY